MARTARVGIDPCRPGLGHGPRVGDSLPPRRRRPGPGRLRGPRDPRPPRADPPGPTASPDHATTSDVGAFPAGWAPWAAAFEIEPAGDLTVLADGAAWIRAAASELSPAAGAVLDSLHASRHIASAAAGLHVEDTAGAAD